MDTPSSQDPQMPQEDAPPPAQPLPPLRQDLQILEGPQMAGGAPSWLLYDPLAHKFHAIAQRGLALLSAWDALPPPEFLAQINQSAAQPYDEQDIEDMTGFLYAQKLTSVPPGLATEELAAQERAASPPWHSTILHKYLFFRVPLFRPQALLRAAYPFIAPLYGRAFTVLIALMGLIGFWFALEQWDVFKATFLHFLTFEGMMFYGLTLVILKAIHELGHAFMSHRFGCKVPIIGVAFLVMFPILYTDTTDAHRLKSKRERVLIDAAGMLAELSIACIALFAWSFLPDGPARSAAFFTATTSWGLSLMVNLNPFMRFDGYYLMSDLTGQRNLQEHGFALGRWHMRETLFGLGRARPIEASAREQFWLICYAYGTWIYRFFLFIGIAILVHALFPKAIGIFLFSVEIAFFIIKPILAELKNWWSFRMDIINSKRSLLTSLGVIALGLILFVPWQTHVSAPALLQPAVQTQIFAQGSGQVEKIYVQSGEAVRKGQRLIKLSSGALTHEAEKSALRISLLEAQLARRSADAQDRMAGEVLQRALRKERANLAGTKALQAALDIRAPHSGIVVELSPELHIGRAINPQQPLARILQPEQLEILSFASETQIARIEDDARVKFIADNAFAQVVTGHVNFIAPTNEDVLTEPIFSSEFRGPIATKPAGDGSARPAAAIIRLKAVPDKAPIILRAERGIVRIKAAPQSPARAIYRRIAQVLLRETDF